MREFIVDWFQVTIFPKDDIKKELVSSCYNTCFDDFNVVFINYLFKKLFNIESSFLTVGKGYNGYDLCICYNNIKIMTATYRGDMGYNIILSGTACRDYEFLNLTWFDLVTNIFLVSDHFNINRIDIAIDSINLEDYTIDQLYSLIKNGLCCTKFKKCINIDSLIIATNESTGRNLQFGSKSSDIEITFYDKYNERLNSGYELSEDIHSWYRCELRFRHDNALELFYKFLNNTFTSDYILGVLYNYIDFKANHNYEQLCKNETAKFWLDFLNCNKKMKLSSRSSESSICKKKIWLCHSVSKSELMVYLADLKTSKNLEIDYSYVVSFLSKGIENLNSNDLSLINDYRIKNNMSIYTLDELRDYIKEIVNIKK